MIAEIEHYLKAIEKSGKSQNTYRTYKKDILKFSDYFNFNCVQDIEHLTSNQYREFLYAQEGLSPKSQNGLLRSISALNSWLLDSGYIENNSFEKVKFGKNRFVREPKKTKTILSDEEVEKLIKAGKDSKEKFLLALLSFTGLRRDSVTKIKMSDIHECKILVRNTKGDKPQVMPLHDVVCHLMNIYLAERNTDSEYLFYSGNKVSPLTGTTVTNIVHRACKKAGITDISAHRLRATFGTKVYKEHGLLAAQKVLNHSSSLTTQLYITVDDEMINDAVLNQKISFNMED